jgi:hypothetical protein
MLYLKCAEEESNLTGYSPTGPSTSSTAKRMQKTDGIGSLAWQQSAVRTGFSSYTLPNPLPRFQRRKGPAWGGDVRFVEDDYAGSGWVELDGVARVGGSLRITQVE